MTKQPTSDPQQTEPTNTPLLERAAQSSQAEDAFVALFAEVFGLEKTQLLAPEFPFLDIDGTPRFIDFALRAAQRKIAFEVDGPTHYQPPDFDRNKYEDDLLRQNSLIHQGWHGLPLDRPRAGAQSRPGEGPAGTVPGPPAGAVGAGRLPAQAGRRRGPLQPARPSTRRPRLARADPRRGQDHRAAGARHRLRQDRHRHRRRQALRRPRALPGHRKTLVQQTGREFARLWPDVDHGRIEGGRWQPERHVVCASVQALGNRFSEIDPSASAT
jgi:hypothetical protein